jgi:putative ABC transport system permease protein
MNNLFTSKLAHHPGRTLAILIGTAVCVILVVLTIGLVRGTLRDRGQRDANIGFEIMLRRSGQGSLPPSDDMSIPESDIEAVRAVPGVAVATPIGQTIEMGASGGFGIRQNDGIDFQSFAAASNLRIVEGQPLPQSGDVAIIDYKEAANHRVKVGDKIRALGRDLTVVGIYEPEVGGHVKVPLATMQGVLGAPGKCSMIFVKCQNPAEQEAVAAHILERFPDYSYFLMRGLSLPSDNRIAAYNVFLRVLKWPAIVIFLLIIMLTTYALVFRKNRRKMSR